MALRELKSLLSDVENATKKDKALDARLLLALGYEMTMGGMAFCGYPGKYTWYFHGGMKLSEAVAKYPDYKWEAGNFFGVKPYTESTEAVTRLIDQVLPDHNLQYTRRSGRHLVRLTSPAGDEYEAMGASQPLASVAALLRGVIATRSDRHIKRADAA